MAKEPLRGFRAPISGERERDVPRVRVEMPPTNWTAVGILVVTILGALGALAGWLDYKFGVLDGRIDVLVRDVAGLEGLIEGWRNPIAD